MLKIIAITKIDAETIKNVFNEQKLKDLEDLIQYNSAIEEGMEFIVTRNIKDFPRTDELIIIKPEELVKIIETASKNT